MAVCMSKKQGAMLNPGIQICYAVGVVSLVLTNTSLFLYRTRICTHPDPKQMSENVLA
jgi:hypothetical protein